jgi:hypothetical protein
MKVDLIMINLSREKRIDLNRLHKRPWLSGLPNIAKPKKLTSFGSTTKIIRSFSKISQNYSSQNKILLTSTKWEIGATLLEAILKLRLNKSEKESNTQKWLSKI